MNAAEQHGGRAAAPPNGVGIPPEPAAPHPGDIPPPVVPGVPQPTVGPGGPDTAGPTVHHPSPAADRAAAAGDDPGWAASVTGRFGHYIPDGATRVEHHSLRPAAYGVCGVHGFVDEQGLDDGARLPHCPECERLRAREVVWPS